MDQRLKGQEVEVRVTSGTDIVQSLTSIKNFDDGLVLEIKQDGYLGEVMDRFDEVATGFKGGFEFHVTTTDYENFIQRVLERAQRINPSLVFNIIRTDFFPNGETAIVTYTNVVWGPFPRSTSGRTEYVNVKAEWATDTRSMQLNNL